MGTTIALRVKFGAGRGRTCRTMGCNRPCNGISTHCSRCNKRRARTGSYWKASLSGAELKLFTRSAERLLAGSRNVGINFVTAEIDQILDQAGPVASVYDLRPLPPADKARALFARLRNKGVKGLRILAIALGVRAMAQSEGMYDVHYINTQTAKAVARLSSATRFTTSTRPMKPRYASSTGRAMGLAGKQIWQSAGVLADEATLRGIAAEAQRGMAQVRRAEERRRATYQTRKKTRDAIERLILQARSRGAGGPQSFDEVALRRKLRTQYGVL